jgi:hypothetical protein
MSNIKGGPSKIAAVKQSAADAEAARQAHAANPVGSALPSVIVPRLCHPFPSLSLPPSRVYGATDCSIVVYEWGFGMGEVEVGKNEKLTCDIVG